MKAKNLINRIIITTLVSLIFQTTYCQENYLPGFIVSLKSDTLRGFIDYRNWAISPDKIFFKERLNDTKIIYTPIDIKGFNIHDEKYESAIIKVEVSPININALESNPELKIEIDTTFLQTMIQGVKCLYFYKNGFGKEQFYIKQDSSYELLIYKKYLKVQHEDGKSLITENKKYIGQLTIYLYDCKTIQLKLNELEYRKKSLENLFLFYYNCSHSVIKFQKKTEKTSTEIGILTGLSLTTLDFSSAGYDYLEKADYDISGNFTTGIFFNIILPRNQGKWSINNELIFTSYKVNGYSEIYKNDYEYKFTNTTIGNSYIKMNNMVRFKYPVGRLYLYFNAGISNGYVVTETNQMKQRSKYYSIENIKEDKAYTDIRSWERGFNLGLGIKLKKFSFEGRYEYGDGNSASFGVSLTTTRYYFLFGYSF